MKRTLEERQLARSRRWAKSQGIESVERIGETDQLLVLYTDRAEVVDSSPLIEKGLVDKDTLFLTDAGELRLLQLEIRKWMSERYTIDEKGRLHKKE